MKLSRLIDYRESMFPDMSESKVVAKISIIHRATYGGGVHKEKTVKFIELDAPVKVTEHFVTTKDVPFIYSQRKSIRDFNYLDTSGEGIFLCRDINHLEQVMTQIEADYDSVLTEMRETINEMYAVNDEKFHITEVRVGGSSNA